MSGIQSSAPVPAQQIPPVAERGADSFVETQLQLHKLQEQLQMVLFNFCRVLRPSIIEEHHWPCYAAAELPHIATAVLDFCEGDEDPIEHRGVSPKKRKKFIRDLRMCRLIRNAVAHCLPITEDQMMRFATSGRRIIAMVKRVLGPQYETEMAAIVGI
ncbi:uncharacterized protein K452DRAFT_300302 [Aplosporella prunicola CBS 121167]|uniref:Swt1-like HEPN domain-containing protein n=1 Tax=Aplosporella prunicola CBS 121167 TaxID=1176127 RepID=A0A6A6B7J7_9PEZI|nr:uncharacterized protein K452DRAFT_300302 [Aplosporella prunicola CBS 121167]KAF2139225.1 hypothetical protein K452DRAFT_300302 [Aplosporella prunicola CBS 121167]